MHNKTQHINEAPTERFLQSAANNLKKQMKGKSYSKDDLLNRLNSTPLANHLKPVDLEKIVNMAMNESVIKEELEPEDYIELREIIRAEIASIFFDLYKKKNVWIK